MDDIPDLTAELDAAEDVAMNGAEVATEWGYLSVITRRPGECAEEIRTCGHDEHSEAVARALAADLKKRLPGSRALWYLPSGGARRILGRLGRRIPVRGDAAPGWDVQPPSSDGRAGGRLQPESGP